VPAVPLTAAQAADFAAGVQALRSIGYDVGGYDLGGYDRGGYDVGGNRGGDPAAGELDADAIAPVILAFQRRWLPHHLNGQFDPPTLLRAQQIAELYAGVVA
jgi:hypothetical protein